ncbi:hypothetical protein D7X88_13475 [bacterium C-53]|nr:hypothetical protein [Lachnospiraceae bacterium]NBI04025.1 hypothetical protein [Lachnospiraceae bacterium]RKJ08803.1 hypothetical protein D7X88_13475 [bacterium C-53]
MTVHQAKGLEWDKVIISVTPNKFDKIRHFIPELQASINAYIEKSKKTIAYEFIQ